MKENPLMAVCCYCGKVIRFGKTGPNGEVSHGICDPCLEENFEPEETE